MSKLSLKPTTSEVGYDPLNDVNTSDEKVEETNVTEDAPMPYGDELTAEEKEVIEDIVDSDGSVNKSRFNKAVEYVSNKYNLSSDYSIVSYAEKKNSVIVCVEDNDTSLRIEIKNPYEVGIYSLY